MRQHVVWDTGAGVLDGETYVVSRRRLFRPEGLAFDNGVERLESERAARLHRIPGIDGEVENDQLDLVWIDLEGFKPLLPRKGEELRNELRAPISSGLDQFDAFLVVRPLHCAGEQTRVGEHDTEQVIEIVRHACRDLPRLHQVAAIAERRLRPSPVVRSASAARYWPLPAPEFVLRRGARAFSQYVFDR